MRTARERQERVEPATERGGGIVGADRGAEEAERAGESDPRAVGEGGGGEDSQQV